MLELKSNDWKYGSMIGAYVMYRTRLDFLPEILICQFLLEEH